MQLPVRNISGEVVDNIEVDAGVFAVPVNKAVVHQALVRQLANARLGTADTKTRAEVSGSTKKLYKQKHTGRARRGSIKSPLLKGGGIAFGPHPRSYRQRMPKKMRHLALRGLLSEKASSGEIVVVDQFKVEQPKTAEMARILAALGVTSSVLVVMQAPDLNVIRSTQNLRGVRTSLAALLNVVDITSHRFLVISVDGLRAVESNLAEKSPARVG